MGTTIAILAIIAPFGIALIIFVINSLVDSRIEFKTKSDFVIIRAQVAQLQNKIAILQVKQGEQADTFIRDRGNEV